MPYVTGPRTYRFRFENHPDLAEDWTKVGGMSIDELLALTSKPRADQDKATMEAFRERLLEWSLQDANGDPLPLDQLGQLDATIALTMAYSWRNHLVNGVGPLGQTAGSAKDAELEAALQLGTG